MEQRHPSDSDGGGLETVPTGNRQHGSRDHSQGRVALLLDTVVQLLAQRVAHDLTISEDAGVRE